LSEARKYRLNLTLANQYLAQVEEQTLAAVFGNVGTLIAFQVGAQDAEVLTEQLGGDLTPRDMLILPHYHAYIRLLVNGMPTAPFTLRTVPAAKNASGPDRSAIIRAQSRWRYARPVADVERDIRQAFTVV
jgi:hypothetical protein